MESVWLKLLIAWRNFLMLSSSLRICSCKTLSKRAREVSKLELLYCLEFRLILVLILWITSTLFALITWTATVTLLRTCFHSLLVILLQMTSKSSFTTHVAQPVEDVIEDAQSVEDAIEDVQPAENAIEDVQPVEEVIEGALPVEVVIEDEQLYEDNKQEFWWEEDRK
mmetsp:Transcript_20870/g.30670  ORF Transcript_20870/g.30670 Transcript_20870/m.30670 type:complete len:168 (+) Transcript_20870:742-1245(+)